MTEEKLMETIIAERIGMLLEQAGIHDDDEAFRRGEAIIEGLEEEKRLEIENYIDRLTDLEARRAEVLYRGGFRNGIRLMAGIERIVTEDRKDTEQEARLKTSRIMI